MKTKTKLFSLATFVLAALGACGDVDRVQVNLDFPDDATERSTQKLLFVVREAPMVGNGCAALWMKEPTGLAENQSIVDYPYKNDVVAAPIKLSQYPAL